jgi:predicted nucleic acid-binding protein
VPERWIVYASPLIALANVKQENLLFELADEIAVPNAVAIEIMAGPPQDLARQLIEKNQIPILKSTATPLELAAWDLGAGETDVLSFAITHPGWTAILDDGLARKCAAGFSIPVKGTLAVVILAKLHGLIESAADLMRELQNNGFRIRDDIVRRALQHTVNEVWD